MSEANGMFDLTGRRALVTGSTQGIGLALARGLAQSGATVVLNGRDAARLDAAAQALRAEEASTSKPSASMRPSTRRCARRSTGSRPRPAPSTWSTMPVCSTARLQDFPADAFERLLQTNIASVSMSVRRLRAT